MQNPLKALFAQRAVQPFPTEDDHAPDDFTHLGLNADADMMTRTVMDRRRRLGLIGADGKYSG